jgi:hypothetical protein
VFLILLILLILTIFLLVIFFRKKSFLFLSKINNEDDKVFYDWTEIQYVREGSYVKIKKEWYKILRSSSRYSATIKVYLEHEKTKEKKEIEVSPEFWVKYKIYQKL